MTNKGWRVSVPVSVKLSGGTIEARKLVENCLFHNIQQFIN